MDYHLKTSKNINKDQKNPDLSLSIHFLQKKKKKSLSIQSTCPIITPSPSFISDLELRNLLFGNITIHSCPYTQVFHLQKHETLACIVRRNSMMGLIS